MKGRRIKGIEKHSNEWIALNEMDEIIASAKTLKKVMRDAQKVTKKPAFMKVPRLDVYLAP